jgi:TrwC relaxase/Glycosyl hydrolases family 32 N-terminal domain
VGDPDLRHWNTSVGHAISTDLVQWQVVADALTPSTEPAFDDLATWTGSVVRGDDDTWYLFYTGLSKADDGLVQRVGLATSEDLTTWRKHGSDLLVTADSRWYATLDGSGASEAWRDPWIVRGPDGDATVAASETYNTSLERHLRDALGLRFAERANPDARKRPVREVVGVDPALNQRWSARRAAILVRHSELAADFQANHGRPPTPVESLHLAQQATLQTREAKHEPRTLAEQRATWRTQAVEVLGGPKKVSAMISRSLSPEVAPGATVDSAWVADASARVLAAMEERRSTWQTWHVRAEALRQVRGTEVPTGQVDRLVDLLVGEVLDSRSVSLARPEPGIVEPEQLRRADGSSVYTVAGAELFTSARIMHAEQRQAWNLGTRSGTGCCRPSRQVSHRFLRSTSSLYLRPMIRRVDGSCSRCLGRRERHTQWW